MPANPETLFPKLVHLLLDTVFVVDEYGKIAFVSEACERLLGYTPAELTGTAMFRLIYPEDLKRTQAAAKRVIGGLPHIDFENRYLHKDGRVVHIQWSARWSEEDRVRIAVARDVTALKRAEQIQNAVYRISQAAHSTESLSELCQEIHTVIGELLSTDELHFAFYDPAADSLSFLHVTSARPRKQTEGVCGPDVPLERGSAIAKVICSGRALLAKRDESRPGLGIETVSSTDGANWLGVPLASAGRVLGAVVIESCSPSGLYNEEDRNLLYFVASQIAVAIEHKQSEERLRFIAHHDSLTGLTNRQLFYDRLDMALRLARRKQGRVALLYLDLNSFKQVNDNLGHEVGDQLLCEVARRLERCTRESDTVARMGGDEFTILLTNIRGPSSVDAMVAKIREIMAVPFERGENTLDISFSIGVAIYPQDGQDPQSLLRHADAGMYCMKRNSEQSGRSH